MFARRCNLSASNRLCLESRTGAILCLWFGCSHEEECMRKGVIAGLFYGAVLLGAPLTAAYSQWTPGSELVGQSVQVETNGIVNTVYFDPAGAARIVTPAGSVVQGT